MSRDAKRIERMLSDPRDVRPDELFDVLRAEGVTVRRHGSHVGLQRGAQRMTMALPHDGGHVKAPYVLRALKVFGLAAAAEVERETRRRHEDVDLHRAEDGSWMAEVRDMPGCLTHGATRGEALANVAEAKACWSALDE